MATPLTIACPHCHTLNRVPPGRLSEGGKCGQCHQPLFAGQPINLDAAHFDRHATTVGFATAGGLLGGVVRPMPCDGAGV